MVFQVDPHVACVLIVVGILKDRTGALKRKRLPGYPNSHTTMIMLNARRTFAQVRRAA